jgi:teichuronic acid biosynthesis glycosyltransferase TuaH
MPAYLASLDVGLTPYADTSFNRASFPLKTLDYLAAGLPCVATPSPAVDWLDTDLVVTADSAEDFAESAVRAATGGHDGRVAVRKEFAERHSWEARARTLLDRLERLDLVTGPDP